MEPDSWEDLARRLTALVIKLDERNERLDQFLAAQVSINQRLERLIARVFPLDANGRPS